MLVRPRPAPSREEVARHLRSIVKYVKPGNLDKLVIQADSVEGGVPRPLKDSIRQGDEISAPLFEPVEKGLKCAEISLPRGRINPGLTRPTGHRPGNRNSLE